MSKRVYEIAVVKVRDKTQSIASLRFSMLLPLDCFLRSCAGEIAMTLRGVYD